MYAQKLTGNQLNLLITERLMTELKKHISIQVNRVRTNIKMLFPGRSRTFTVKKRKCNTCGYIIVLQ